jgi:hypothetical protein
MYKVYCSILNERISKFCESEKIIHDEQNGFVKDRSTIDHVYTLTSIVETRKLKILLQPLLISKRHMILYLGLNYGQNYNSQVCVEKFSNLLFHYIKMFNAV